MFWADKLIKQLDQEQLQIVNDSKTPSGRAHVGALRGVIIHDTIFKALKEQGFKAHYTFGVDDYDPLDELPYGRDEQFEPFLGQPLCEVPPPPNTTASDMADYYISEFFTVFKDLGVQAQTYRLRDIYRSGQFDTYIDTILANADKVRDIYLTVGGSVRPSDWLPV
ncbi:lysyl-tRNA synthetase, partial [Achromatium sp. WMS1]